METIYTRYSSRYRSNPVAPMKPNQEQVDQLKRFSVTVERNFSRMVLRRKAAIVRQSETFCRNYTFHLQDKNNRQAGSYNEEATSMPPSDQLDVPPTFSTMRGRISGKGSDPTMSVRTPLDAPLEEKPRRPISWLGLFDMSPRF